MKFQNVTIQKSGPLVRGAVLGRKCAGAARSAVKPGGNVGSGTFLLDAARPLLNRAHVGVYRLRCTVAGVNAATFILRAPDYSMCGNYAFDGDGASVRTSHQIRAVITHGDTDFAIGDGFDITVAAIEKFGLSVATETDGSQIPVAILAADVDATNGDVVAAAHFAGAFAAGKLVFDSSWAVATLEAAFRQGAAPITVKSRRVRGRFVARMDSDGDGAGTC